MSDLTQIFSSDGPLARQLQGFKPRPQQVEMAQAVAEALKADGCLVAEAGTGTGKTLAYLVPAILSGKKTIVSTATKTLQDQLFRKDLPVVRRALGEPFRPALLKGRGNYLCLYRLDNAFGPRAGHGEKDLVALEAIRRWSKTTASGDIAEASGVPESSPLWPAVTSTVDNCLGQECPKYADCFLVKARRAAQEADVLVVNHHLVWADWTLRNDGFGEILPEAQAIIVDEAHQFLESATQFLGLSFSSRQLSDLTHDIAVERFKDAPDAPGLLDEAERLERLNADMRLVLGEEAARRDAWHAVAGDPAVGEVLAALRQQLAVLTDALKAVAMRGKGLESCAKRCADLATRLELFLAEDASETVCWFETRKRGFSLNRTPLAVAEEFGKFRLSSKAAWVFASATLTVGGKFDHFTHQFGLRDAVCQAWDSPFDYRTQSLLYLPPGLPDPGTPDYNRAALRAAVPVLRASRGRAFVLFTSHQALLEAAALLPLAVDYPLFVQGSQPKTALLEQFKRAGNGILLGTASFWEGVDVPGAALSCVIIDKLPFAAPNDPVLSARLDSLKKNGLNPFVVHQLPSAIITLKQGVGRLIRDQDDRGVLMICDPRIVSRSYGKLFLDSLPDMPRSRSVRDVERFFAEEFERNNA